MGCFYVLSEGHTFLISFYSEYTVLQAQAPREQRRKERRHDSQLWGVMDKLAERSTQSLDPAWHTGRDDSVGAYETFVTTSHVRGGTLRRTPRATLRSFDSPAKGGLQYPRHRGRVANTVN